MDIKPFTDQSPGRLVKIELPRPDYAFLPDALPHDWQMAEKLWPLLMSAHKAIAKLDGVGMHMPDHSLLLRPLQQREALRSSSMEGTYASPEELLLYQEEPREPKSDTDPANDWREVNNYGSALLIGQKMLDDGYPLSLQVIRSLHSELLSGVRGDEKSPGEFRDSQVIVGAGARFIPPPAHHLPDCLASFENSLKSAVDIDPLIWAFLIHYQFETIHPFRDGNGRVGRLLLSLQIYKGLGLGSPWLYLSAFFERHKDEYIDLLFRVSTHGDWDRWIEFCLVGAYEQAEDSLDRFEKLVHLKDEYLGLIEAEAASPRLYPIVESLLERPVVTIPAVAKKTDVSYPTARGDINRLVELGILVEGPENIRPKYFYAPNILQIAYVK